MSGPPANTRLPWVSDSTKSGRRARTATSRRRVAAIGWDNSSVDDAIFRWRNTTHDWASSVDDAHLAEVREHPSRFAAGGTAHLIFEVIAHAADEAANTGNAARCVVSLHNDGSVSVADNGRGTEPLRHVRPTDQEAGHGDERSPLLRVSRRPTAPRWPPPSGDVSRRRAHHVKPLRMAYGFAERRSEAWPGRMRAAAHTLAALQLA
jgi:hypothetical protein